jgi:hypothetical protein
MRIASTLSVTVAAGILLLACGSDSSGATGAAADGGPAGGDAGANVEGGSSTPPPDPGPCTHPDCPVYTLVRDEIQRVRADALVLAGDHVFYLHTGASEPGIYALPKAGGAPKKLAAVATPVASQGQSCRSLASDGAHVYFVSGGATTTLQRVPVGGGAAEVVIDKPVSCPTVDGGDFFWSEPETNGADRRGLWQRALAGGTPARVVDDAVVAYAAHGSSFYWFNTVGLRTAPKTGGAPTTVRAVGKLSTARLVADDGGLYFFDAGALEGVQRFPYDGGAPERVPFEGTNSDAVVRGLLADGATLYWIQRGRQDSSGPILRRPLGETGKPITYRQKLAAVDIAVDDAWVYFSDDIGSIRKFRK